MPWINYDIFTDKWLERAQRRSECVDDGDRFISLWVAFNSWMRGKFGEYERDSTLIDKLKKYAEIKTVFNDLRRKDQYFSNNLQELSKYSVADMRGRKPDKKYDGTFGSLIEVIYQVRCNLFHGRKDIDEDRKDFELVTLSYRILLPLFKEYLTGYRR